MMLINFLKFAHILSCALLLASMIYAIKAWWLRTSNHVVQQLTWLVILPTLLFILMSGLIMLVINNIALSLFWVAWGFGGIGIILISWLGFAVNLLLSEPITHYRDRKIQGALLLTCIIAILFVIFLMTNKIS